MLAPIVLFLYSRPDHSLRTLQALRANKLSDQSKLYIFCDGAKEGSSQTLLAHIAQTKAIAKQEKWCKEVEVIEQPANKGLADSIVGGVTDIISKYGKIIVLEDDIVTAPDFLTYMNQALNLYKDDERVMHIAGYNLPIDTSSANQTYFSPHMSCWGWATWQRAWKNFDRDADKIHAQLSSAKNGMWNFDMENSRAFYPQLKANIKGKIKTWAIFWYANIFLKDGLCLMPEKSFVQNIGFDGSGENCGEDTSHSHEALASLSEPLTRRKLLVNNKIHKHVIQFYTGRSDRQMIRTRVEKKAGDLINPIKKMFGK